MREFEYYKDALVYALTEAMDGKSLYEFSKQTQIPYKTLHQWLKKTRTPSMEYLILLSERLGLSVDYLLGLKDY